jgi:hypothetical protein
MDVERDEQAFEAAAGGSDGETAALERLKVALAASVPGLRPERIGGATVAEVEASFAAAKALADELREAARREVAATVPAGAPGRRVESPATAYDKIRQGLGRLA